MNTAKLWANASVTKQVATNTLREFGHLLRWGKSKSNILEVGCGEGSVTRNILFSFVKDRARKLVALDLLEHMIDLAKKENRIEKIEFRTGDIMDRNNINQMKVQFDHIFSLCVAHLIPDTREYFAGLNEILKSNGQIFVVALTDTVLERSFRVLHQNKWSRYSGCDSIFTDFTNKPSEHIRGILEDVGYTVDLCRESKTDYVEENIPDTIRALVQMYHQMGRIPGKLEEEYIQDNIRYCCENSPHLGEQHKHLVSVGHVTCIASKRT